MKKHSFFVVFVTLMVSLSLAAPVFAQDSTPLENTIPTGTLVMSVLVSSFQGKDKFYGTADELSQGLHQFFTFSLEALTAQGAQRISADTLWQEYPSSKVYPNTAEKTLTEKVDVAQLEAAAEAKNVRYVLCIEITKTAVLVKDKIHWTISAGVRTVVYDSVKGTLSEEKSYSHDEVYDFASKEDADAAKQGFLTTFSGRKISMPEVISNPMLFGGTVGGYSFVPIARQLAADMRFY